MCYDLKASLFTTMNSSQRAHLCYDAQLSDDESLW